MPFGRQLALSSRRATVVAALFYMVQIEQAWMQRSGDRRFSEPTALMALIGVPGCGESHNSNVPLEAAQGDYPAADNMRIGAVDLHLTSPGLIMQARPQCCWNSYRS